MQTAEQNHNEAGPSALTATAGRDNAESGREMIAILDLARSIAG